MLGTLLCDTCYELERHITRRPDVARKILAAVDKTASAVGG